MDFQHAGRLDARHVYLGGVLSPGASNGRKESSVVIAPFPAVRPQALTCQTEPLTWLGFWKFNLHDSQTQIYFSCSQSRKVGTNRYSIA